MNEHHFKQLIETARVRPLTADEATALRHWMLMHPEARAEWEAEQQLNQALAALPPVAVPSNFTARVLASTCARGIKPARSRWRWWTPLRFAAPALAVAMIGLSIWHYRAHQQRLMVESLSSVAVLGVMPNVEALRDFEAIRRLDRLSSSDDARVLKAFLQ